jgi:hypothetical protein
MKSLGYWMQNHHAKGQRRLSHAIDLYLTVEIRQHLQLLGLKSSIGKGDMQSFSHCAACRSAQPVSRLAAGWHRLAVLHCQFVHSSVHNCTLMYTGKSDMICAQYTKVLCILRVVLDQPPTTNFPHNIVTNKRIQVCAFASHL